MDFEEYGQKARETVVYEANIDAATTPRITALSYAVLGLTSEAGEVAAILKRTIRDEIGDNTDSPFFRIKMAHELGDVLWYANEVAHLLGYDLEKIAAMNIDKLADRRQREAVKGEGDER